LLLDAQKRALEMIVRGAPLSDTLTYLARMVEEEAGGTAVASILLVDDAGCLYTGGAPSLPHDYCAAIDGLKAREDLGTCSVVAVTGKVVVTPDIGACPKWQSIKHLPLALGLKSAWSQPILGADGRVLATFGTYFKECRAPTAREQQLVEVLAQTAALAIERSRADEAKEVQRKILNTATEAAEMGTWSFTLHDGRAQLSPRAQILYGLPDAVWTHDEVSIAALVHPEDQLRMRALLDAATDPKGDGRYRAEYRVRRADGGWRWLSVWGLVEFDNSAERRPIAVTGASRDITAQKQAEQQQQMLVGELAHRVKNTLAIVQSIARQTFRHASGPQDFEAAFTARIDALGRAHSLLTDASWKDVQFHDVAEAIFKPYEIDRSQDVIQLDGPPISVQANTAVTLSLILHELATNAAKYGALLSENGRIAVSWTKRATGLDEYEISLRWRESGGPRVRLPRSKGLGSKLIESGAKQLGGRSHISFLPDGLECEFVFLSRGAPANAPELERAAVA
jgi:PAS domain S-box-containing protein